MFIEGAKEEHYDYVVERLNEWWSGRKMTDMLPRLFFTHFKNTSFVAKVGDQIVGFLVGFMSAAEKETSYIHFAGVDPDYRSEGVGRSLYSKFFELSKNKGALWVKCVTSPVNKNSIAFHQAMGFSPSKVSPDGVPAAIHNHDGPGEDRVIFFKKL